MVNFIRSIYKYPGTRPFKDLKTGLRLFVFESECSSLVKLSKQAVEISVIYRKGQNTSSTVLKFPQYVKQSFSTITPDNITRMRALYIQWRVGVATKSVIFLIAPIPEAIFLDNLSMCDCHRRFSSINIPSDFTEVT